MAYYHVPVLLQSVIDTLQVQEGKHYIDATFGGGGHSTEIEKNGGIVLGIDQDPEAIKHAQTSATKVVHGNFRDIQKIAKDNGFEKVHGILFDLGMSSYHIDESERGFSFLRDEPLDMRMNPHEELTASEIVNTWSQEKLFNLFSKTGEEAHAAEIARIITEARKEKSIDTSHALAELIKNCIRKTGMIHPATKVFMALRIQVNNELENLRVGLEDSVEILEDGGRIAVISFHSLEDRIVKLALRKAQAQGLGKVITKKPITPTNEERRINNRSRSAKLRVFEKKR